MRTAPPHTRPALKPYQPPIHAQPTRPGTSTESSTIATNSPINGIVVPATLAASRRRLTLATGGNRLMLAEDKDSVVAAEAEAVAHRHLHRHAARRVRNTVEIAERIGSLEVDR